MMPTKDQLPIPWNKWTRGGILGILLGIIGMQQVWIHDRDKTIKELSQQNSVWLNKFIDDKVQKASTEKLQPKVNEVRAISDSVKTEIIQP